ncbi:Glycerol-3-phosphate dehydrogenase [NAD(P)+] [bioreactor metagenome]|uniref:Glycerol-3-phosphate dehydrogenase [NAD(P)+] n=1 Tax=bioreactor metagenome TaxID=1076179 RepID=A0A644T288_9ZZZZ
MKIAVIGAGSWGTAMAGMLATKNQQVALWARNPALAEQINSEQQNKSYLPDIKLPHTLYCTSDLVAAVNKAEIVVLATPSHAIGDMAVRLANLVSDTTILVNAAKGLEPKTFRRMSEVINAATPSASDRVVALSGPTHAEEVGLKFPSAAVVASSCRLAAEKVQDAFMLPYFRVYTNPDIIGVELGGALKNIIALGAGIIEGLSLGDNTKAALMTRGITEITRLGVAMGGQQMTFSGLSGIGDLIVTCTSKHSRNRRAGILLAAGKTINQIETETNMVVEGIKATWAAYHLAKKHGVEMPITAQIFAALYENRPPMDAVMELMTRGKTNEVEEIVSDNIIWTN